MALLEGLGEFGQVAGDLAGDGGGAFGGVEGERGRPDEAETFADFASPKKDDKPETTGSQRTESVDLLSSSFMLPERSIMKTRGSATASFMRS